MAIEITSLSVDALPRCPNCGNYGSAEYKADIKIPCWQCGYHMNGAEYEKPVPGRKCEAHQKPIVIAGVSVSDDNSVTGAFCSCEQCRSMQTRRRYWHRMAEFCVKAAAVYAEIPPETR